MARDGALRNGDIRYARHSTVVESVLSELYPAANRDGPRADPAALPSRGRPESPPGTLDVLLAGRVEVEPEQREWHAVFAPWRDLLVGPRSSHHRVRLQDEFYLRLDTSGVRHLSNGSPIGLCGRAAGGDELPFHRPHWLE